MSGAVTRMSANDHFERSNVYLEQEKYQKAIEECKKALEIDPKYDKAWFFMGFAYGELGEQKKAIESLQKGLKINPEDVDAWNNMGIAYDCLNEYEKEIDCYKKAIKIEPEDDLLWGNLEITYKKLYASDEETIKERGIKTLHSEVSTITRVVEELAHKYMPKTERVFGQVTEEMVEDYFQSLGYKVVKPTHEEDQIFKVDRIAQMLTEKSQEICFISIKKGNVSNREIKKIFRKGIKLCQEEQYRDYQLKHIIIIASKFPPIIDFTGFYNLTDDKQIRLRLIKAGHIAKEFPEYKYMFR